MDGLRLLLLVFGLIVVAAVYVYTRYQRKKIQDSPQQDLFEERREPLLTRASRKPKPRDAKTSDTVRREPRIDDFDAETATDEESEAPDEPPVTPSPQKIVTLRIVARNHGAFPGDELVLSLRGIGMRHGKFGIFHRLEGSQEDSIVFSAASLVEPGSFDLANIREQQIPGISLFMILPGPMDGAKAFDLMMSAARTLSQSLDAELLDESGSTLSIQRERYLREEIIQYQHSSAVA